METSPVQVEVLFEDASEGKAFHEQAEKIWR